MDPHFPITFFVDLYGDESDYKSTTISGYIFSVSGFHGVCFIEGS